MGVSGSPDPAFQDLMPFNHCWGCGADNPDGLRLKSRWADVGERRAVATFTPKPEHMAGPTHILNGGIIATVLDCHGVCTAVADAYVREGRAIGEGETIWFATGSLEVVYVRPAPIDTGLEVRARVVVAGDRKTGVACELVEGDDVCARADVIAVRVQPTWLQR